MSSTLTTTRSAEDNFEAYYAEKLWEMIPPIYRLEDGLAMQPDVLRSLVEILARQAAILRRSQDHLWDDAFIELCNEWAVPYIGELLGTRLVSAVNTRGRRIDVAKTIYYRRRKGTLRVLEELIADITGWEGKVVEQFKRLGRARHGLDPAPERFASRISGTHPGGWADLRRPGASELNDGPFDEFFHTPEMHQAVGRDGIYNIPKLAFYLYRLVSYEVTDVTPFMMGTGLGFGFDPSGRVIPLFGERVRDIRLYDADNPDHTPYNWDEWRSAMEWELPLPIRCRLLGDSAFLFTEQVVDALAASPGLTMAEQDDLRTLIGWPIRGESRLRRTLAALPNGPSFLNPPNYVLYRAILDEALILDCGKRNLLPNALRIRRNMVDVPRPQIASGSLALWDTDNMPEEKTTMVDPEHGKFAFEAAAAPQPGELITASYHYGFSGDIGAGPYDRRAVEDVNPDANISGGIIITLGLGPSQLRVDGVTQINDNRTYYDLPSAAGVRNMVFQSANQRRPYISLGQNWTLTADPTVDAVLELDGLWIGCTAGMDRNIYLEGDYERVVIRNTTLDPGGDTDIVGNPIGKVSLVVRGYVELLVVDHSIIGPVQVEGTGFVEELQACDSILQAVNTAYAVDLEATAACMERVTVFGGCRVHTLRSQDAIFASICTVTDTQQGCFRYSAAPIGSRVPRAFPISLMDFTHSSQWFTSKRFGQPGYAQLSAAAPVTIQRGAENGSEIGAFCSLLNPIKLDSLQLKVAEYMPFGLIPVFIPET